MEIPKEILDQGEDKLVEYCQQKLEDSPDYELREGLSDYSVNIDDFFDETPEVEQISDIGDEYKKLFSTNVWDFYSDPEYAENILAENKNMAKYLETRGLVPNEISNICYGNYIKRGSIEVEYVSLWDGDTEIVTKAKLNVDTGEVHNVIQEDVDNLHLCTLSLESIRLEHASSDFDVIEDYESMEYAIDPGSLNQINKLVKQQKVTWANESVFHKVQVKGREFSFQLNTGAYDEAVQPFNGDVLIDDGEHQFTIHVDYEENQLELIKEAVLLVIREKYFSEGLQVGNFNGLSVNSNDLLKETKNLLLQGNADWTPSDIGGLIFKKQTLTNFLEDDYFDEDNKPSDSCLKEVNDIVFAMKNTNSTIMYLE